jgi:hypothetical protein
VLESIDASNVMELLEASRRLQVGVAEVQCCEWLEEHLEAEQRSYDGAPSVATAV